MRAGVLVLSIGVPLVFSEAENRDSLTSQSPRIAAGTVSPRIASGPAQLCESSHPGNGHGGGTAWRAAIEVQDFQPVAFSGLIPPTSPTLTPRTETRDALSSAVSPKTGLRVWEQIVRVGFTEIFPRSLSPWLPLSRQSPRHSATYRFRFDRAPIVIFAKVGED